MLTDFERVEKLADSKQVKNSLVILLSLNNSKNLVVIISSYWCLSVKIFSCSCSFIFFFFFLVGGAGGGGEWQFWNAFFEETVLKCTHVLKCIFWRSNYFNFLIRGCWLAWLLLYAFMAAVLCLHYKQNFFSLDMHKYKFRIRVNWLQSS